MNLFNLVLMAKFKSTTKTKLFLFVSIILIFIIPNISNATVNNYIKLENIQPSYYNPINLGEISAEKESWIDIFSDLDKNENGISDNLDNKLNELLQVGKTQKKLTSEEIINKIYNNDDIDNQITKESINIIIRFPESEFNDAISLFQQLGGNIKSMYSTIINGFAGNIAYEGLIEFSRLLKHDNIPFYIEEDAKGETTLYYTGLNMNVRPYVWNTLGYDGDEDGSIAVLDTGIDDSHNMHEGYSAGDFNNKIVGWQDFVGSGPTPYDDNGHGSHCSGIAAGDGSPKLDTSGRTVSSNGLALDLTGYTVPEQSLLETLMRFNVTEAGTIDVESQYYDYTPIDDVDVYAYIYYNGIMKASFETTNNTWTSNMSYSVPSNELGNYSVRILINFVDDNSDFDVDDANFGFRVRAQWPFNPPLLGSGDPWKGIAHDTHLVGVKVADTHGGVYTSDLVDAIYWVVSNRDVFHITTISISLGWDSSQTSIINACNYAVQNGIVVVVAGGNDGSGGYQITSPGDADKVITVAANNVKDEITEYSGEGGLSYTGATTKPDITAPGGSSSILQIFSTDTDDNDAEGIFYNDWFEDDLAGMQGTSMATPAVAGATNLLIEAMGGYNNWNYTEKEALKVKALLLMTATETYPLQREDYPGDSPLLNRGGKDVHEGYGRINIDMAIEAYTQNLDFISEKNVTISSSLINPFSKHGFACNAFLHKGANYTLELDIPSGSDFDLFIYNDDPTLVGDPIIEASSISSGIGVDESVEFIPTETGVYYIVVKAVSGEGEASLSFNQDTHDIVVSLFAPDTAYLADKFEITAAIGNTGTSDEVNIDFSTFFNNESLISQIIPSLQSGDNQLITFRWSPIEYGLNNLSVLSSNVAGEISLANNLQTQFVDVIRPLIFNYEMQENYPYNWISTAAGTELNMGDDDSDTIPLSFSFPFYNDTFTEVYICSNGYLSFTDSTPTDFTEDNLPSSDSDNSYLIAPFWTDLDPDNFASGFIRYYGNSDYLAIEWNTMYEIDGLNIGTFQVVLNKSGDIFFNYDYTQNTHVGYTCGLNFGLDTRYYNNYEDLYFRNDFSLRFTNDTTSPTWISGSGNITAYYGENFIYNFNAQDTGGIRNYWISDLENFDITELGALSNYTILQLNASYSLEIRAYDFSDNYSSISIIVNVREKPQGIPGYHIVLLIGMIGFSIILITYYKRKKFLI